MSTTNATTKEIDVETLRAWLNAQQPVTIVDVRHDDARAQWAIPGSLHVDAYDALRVGSPGPLADIDLPADRPVVTVCNTGRMSLTAAAILAERGFDAHSLTGGMKAWSLAWNTAGVPIADDAANVIQVRRTGKGCLSYVIGSEGEAAVIDPSVSADVYTAIAREHGWTIRLVIETHVHADHLSRSRELTRQTGARLLLPAHDRVTFPFTPISDGERVSVGRATLTALHTPGHTMESTSFLLNESALFTGDTLFTNGVGRPDLHADTQAACARAAALATSLVRLRRLRSDVLVLPAHTSEPIAFDGKPVVSPLCDIEPWLSQWLVSESAFVERVTSHLPPTPPNFSRILALNEAGEMPGDDPTDLEAGGNRCAVR